MADKKKSPPNITHANGFVHFREPFFNEEEGVPRLEPGKMGRVHASTVRAYGYAEECVLEVEYGIEGGGLKKVEMYGAIEELDAALQRASLWVTQNGGSQETEN